MANNSQPSQQQSNQSSKGKKQPHDEAEASNPHQPNEDEVDEASIESFPASDSPGWGATPVHKNPKKTKDQPQDSKKRH